MKQTCWAATGQLLILSIDDDAVNLMVIEQLLSPEGWRVVSAQDGEEAEEWLASSPVWPDLVFLDYQMNVGDSGDEICRKLRALFGEEQVPIVMCTAMGAGSSALNRCKGAGATDVLFKPFERAKMLDQVQRHCSHKIHAKANGHHAPSPQAPAQPDAAAQQAPSSALAAAYSSMENGGSCDEHSSAQGEEGQQEQPPVLQFCASLGLEYCGKKLLAAGYSLEQVLEMDDRTLRKAGVVVQGQRDKILDAAARMAAAGGA